MLSYKSIEMYFEFAFWHYINVSILEKKTVTLETNIDLSLGVQFNTY